MALRYFPGQTQAWLEARLAEIAADEASGLMVTQAGAGDVSSQSSIQSSISERKRKILWDLNAVNPEGNWLQHIAARVTRAEFRDW